MRCFTVRVALIMLTAFALAGARPASAQERLCDVSFEDCRTAIIQMIRAENVGLDVSFWFMDDTRYSTEIIKRWQAGVPVRIMLDLRADTNYPGNVPVRQALINAGIPIRNKTTAGINHWKTIIYAGQNKMHFSAANFSDGSYSYLGAPDTTTNKYIRYVDEAIYFTDDPAIVQSFMRKYDDLWTDTTNYANLANVNGPLTRNYPTYAISPDLNFPPNQSYQNRLLALMKQETQKIDVAMFRITSGVLPDEMIRRVQAGVPVRLITDQDQYRNPTYFWDSYNVDRMYMAGVQVKWKNNTWEQDMHQKSVILYGLGFTIFGSSNWTSSSSDSQREHNYFTTKPWFVTWFIDQFERKWNNVKAPVDGGGPLSPTMYLDFAPLFPETPVYATPANQALGQGTSVTLKWEGGWWAHKYDIYFGTSSTPPLIVQDFMPGSSTAGVNSVKESYTVTGLASGTTYYWRIVGKTMANKTKSGATWSFTTSGGGAIPPTPTGLSGNPVSATRIDLSWSDVAGEDGYKVERKPSGSATWTQIGTTGANVASYADTNSGLTPATAYNYRVRAYTTAGNSGYSNTITVTTPGAAVSPSDVVLYASEAQTVGNWTSVADSTAAGGHRLNNPDAGGGTITAPVANPANYFEMQFNADAGKPYQLWLRGKAYNNSGYNDSVYAQFSDSVNASDAAVYRIGTTSGTMVNLQNCSGCTLNGWGWQDNGFGTGVLGPPIYFASSGVHTIRIQVREDGFSIDQIVLSPDTYLTDSPGAQQLDTTILPKQNGVGSAPSQGAARVVADAYVRGGPYASTNYGTVSELIAKFSADGQYAREAYVTLDITDVTPSTPVHLRVFGKLSDTRAPSVTVNVYPVASTTWNETTITWSTKPTADTTQLIGSIVVSGTAGQWYDVDLSSFARDKRSQGQTRLSVLLKSPADTLPYATFGSKESGNKPELNVGQ
jgi:hypothetical protein